MADDIYAETVEGSDWRVAEAPASATRRMALKLVPPPDLLQPGDKLLARVSTIESAWTVHAGLWPVGGELAVQVPEGDAYVAFTFRLFRDTQNLSCNWAAEEILPAGNANLWEVHLLNGIDEAPEGERRLTRFTPLE
jgi:hypothetical protein